MGTPQQNQIQPYHSPQMGRNPGSPPQHTYPNVGNVLADLNPDEMRPDQKREGQDWYAVFNPNIRRILDIDLVNTLVHDSVVCCVRFSHDGKYVATGCNRSAQIFEVASGNQVVKLQDESVEKDGDLYIRSVCFSPDGMYLATGAEDKVIRVKSRFFVMTTAPWHLANQFLGSRSGTFKAVPSVIRFPATSKTSTHLTSPVTAAISPPAAETIPSVSGILNAIVRS